MPNSTQLNSFQDASGLVTVAVFRRQAATAQEIFTDFGVDVADDMVAIGGGGVGDDTGYGALLTASYPNDDLSAWFVSSKDHLVADPHFLVGYAIGIKIAGMSRADLREAIHLSPSDSGQGERPEATASVADGFLLVGGGFSIQWTGAGNLATASFPSTNLSWTTRSKDHGIASPATIRTYAIGLRQNLPVGTVTVNIQSAESDQSQHPASVAGVIDGFALTGGGAEVHWHGYGNLLWKLEPATGNDQEFSAASKDQKVPDPSTITAYSLAIQITR